MIRSRLVGWGRFVSRGRVVFWGGFVFGLSTVRNIGNIATVSINRVCHGLGTAIGQQNVVRSTGGITISRLILTKVKSSIVILDGIVVVVGRVGIFVLRFVVGWGGFVGRGRLVGWSRAISQGNSSQAKYNENLKIYDVFE